MKQKEVVNIPFETLYLPAFSYFFNMNIVSVNYNKYRKDIANHSCIEKYILAGFLGRFDSQISINYDFDFIKYLKISHDYMLILRLPEDIRTIILSQYQNLFNKYTAIQTIILIGSAARNSLTEKSDIDIYVIVDDDNYKERKQKISDIQILVCTAKSFHKKTIMQDELAVWVLKYGLILYDNNYIFKYYQSEYKIGLKTLDEKIRLIYTMHNKLSFSHLISRIRIADYTRKMIYHMARYVLILNGEIPLSKGEIPSQLYSYDNYLSNEILCFEQLVNPSREILNHFSSNIFDYFENKYYNKPNLLRSDCRES